MSLTEASLFLQPFCLNAKVQENYSFMSHLFTAPSPFPQKREINQCTYMAERGKKVHF